jgi:hypothetical protein
VEDRVRRSETIVTVTLRDSRGGVDVDDGGIQYEGAILNYSPRVQFGQSIHMRLEPADLFVPDGSIEMKGTIIDNMFRDGAIELWAGVEFELKVSKFANIVDSSTNNRDTNIGNAKPRVVTGIEGFEYLMTDSEADATQLSPPPVAPEFNNDESVDNDNLGEPTGIIGTLRQVTLVEVVQGLELTRKTARIEIRASEQDPLGVVYLRAGKIVWAELDEHYGDDAFYLMSAMRHGMYRVRFGRSTTETNIEKPLAFLILEAMRKMDEGTLPVQRAGSNIPVETRPATKKKKKPVDQRKTPGSKNVDFGFQISTESEMAKPAPAKEKKKKRKKKRGSAVKKLRSGKKARAPGRESSEDSKSSVFSTFFHEAGTPAEAAKEDPTDEIDPTFSSISEAVAELGNSQDGPLIPPHDDS